MHHDKLLLCLLFTTISSQIAPPIPTSSNKKHVEPPINKVPPPPPVKLRSETSIPTLPTTTSPSTTTTEPETTTEYDLYAEERRKQEELRVRSHKEHPECFFGDNRSPVNIDIFDAEPVYYSPLEFINYNTTGMVESDPHNELAETMMGFKNWTNQPYIQGAGLNGSRFNLNCVGHSIHNKCYAAELHFLHIAHGMTYDEASKTEGGIVAIVVFIDALRPVEKPEYPALYFSNPRLFPGDEPLESLPLSTMLPDDTTGFFRYNGSMVLPPCAVPVMYTILSKPKGISNIEMILRFHSHGWEERINLHNKIGQFREERAPIGNRKVVINFGDQKRPIDSEISATADPKPYPWFSMLMIGLLAATSGAAVMGGICLNFKKTGKFSFDNIAMENTAHDTDPTTAQPKLIKDDKLGNKPASPTVVLVPTTISETNNTKISNLLGRFTNEQDRTDYYAEAKRKMDEERAQAHKDHPECFGGENRSPVNIDTFAAEPVYYSPLEFINYNRTGLVQADPDNEYFESMIGFSNWTDRPYIQGGGLNGRYDLEEIQLTASMMTMSPMMYRLDDIHSFNMAVHTMEMHFLHVAHGMTFAEASKVDGGIQAVVVSIQADSYDMYKIAREDPDPALYKNSTIFPGNFTIQSVVLSTLIPKQDSGFYRYNGSMVRPPCSTNVTYTILSQPMEMTYMEMHYRFMSDQVMKRWQRHENISKFVEERAPLGNRKVLVNFGVQRQTSKGAACQIELPASVPYPWFSLLLAIILAASAGSAVTGTVCHFFKNKGQFSFDNMAMDETILT